MRVAMLGYSGLTGASGGFFYDARVAQALREAGDVVDDVALPWLGFGYARGLAGNVLPLPDLHRRSSSSAIDGYDIVMQDEVVHPSMCWRNRRIRAQGLPVVSIVHNLTSVAPDLRHRGTARTVERSYLRTLSGIITVCESTREDIAALDVHDVPVLVARAGRDHVASTISSEQVEIRARESTPLRVLFVGTVSPHKGLHRLVEALAALPSGTASLDVAGSVTQSPAYATAVRVEADRHRHLNVTWHGELDQQRLHHLYRSAHVCALPSDREAYPLAALDAMAFGLPVLLPTAGGASEMIHDGEEGQLLDPQKPADWAAAIVALAHDRDQVVRQGRAALARHAAHGTWTQTGQQIRTFLAELARTE